MFGSVKVWKKRTSVGRVAIARNKVRNDVTVAAAVVRAEVITLEVEYCKSPVSPAGTPIVATIL